MRSYPRNSPHAAARTLALAMLAGGHPCESELALLESLQVHEQLDLSRAELHAVVHTFCEDLLACSVGMCWADLSTLRPAPLFLALCMVELIDLVFAVDSVPAIFAITSDPFIVYTSNIFAILGLRALYFALAAMIHHFKYLKYALALVLVFIGTKILLLDLIGKLPAAVSLGVTFGLIAGGVLVSLWKTRGKQLPPGMPMLETRPQAPSGQAGCFLGPQFGADVRASLPFCSASFSRRLASTAWRACGGLAKSARIASTHGTAVASLSAWPRACGVCSTCAVRKSNRFLRISSSRPS